MNDRLPTPFDVSLAISPEQSMGQIALQLPGATMVFGRLKLIFCCGEQVHLADAVAEKGRDLDAVVAELLSLQRPADLAPETAPSALIDHIIARHHDAHCAQLPELIRMVHGAQAVHRAHPAVPAGLGDLLEEIQQELVAHMHKEEAILFPMPQSSSNPFVGQPIGKMCAEHMEHGNALEQLNALTHDATPPEGACTTGRALYAGIAQLNDDLIHHIHLENNVLFPQFEASAPAPAGCGSPSGCGCS